MPACPSARPNFTNAALLAWTLLVTLTCISHVALADQPSGEKQVEPHALLIEQERQETEFDRLRRQWKTKAKILEKELTQAPMRNLDDLLDRLHRSLEISRLNTTMETMKIELEIARDFIQKGWLETARFYVEQNAGLLKVLQRRVNCLEIRQKNAPSR